MGSLIDCYAHYLKHNYSLKYILLNSLTPVLCLKHFFAFLSFQVARISILTVLNSYFTDSVKLVLIDPLIIACIY